MYGLVIHIERWDTNVASGHSRFPSALCMDLFELNPISAAVAAVPILKLCSLYLVVSMQPIAQLYLDIRKCNRGYRRCTS